MFKNMFWSLLIRARQETLPCPTPQNIKLVRASESLNPPVRCSTAGGSSRRGMLLVFGAALVGARDAEQRAQAILSLCVGGMVLARTTNDPALRKTLRAAARQQALALLEQ